MNLFEKLHTYLCNELKNLFPNEPLAFDRITIEFLEEKTLGHIATNVALVLAKPLKKKPLELASQIIDCLKKLEGFKSASVAGPGFINIFFTDFFWLKELPLIIKEGNNYGKEPLGIGKKINVEFVSVNPTGPLHAGHGRNAILGDCVARLLEAFQYEVTREYYINDAGGQIQALGRSLYLRYKEILGYTINPEDFSNDMYSGDYLIPLAKKLVEKKEDYYLRQAEDSWLPVFSKFAVDQLMKDIRSDLEALGVKIDIYTSERSLLENHTIEEALYILEKKGDLYKGTLTPPKGHSNEQWQQRFQTLFRSTTYGDDCDRPLTKPDGSWTYFAGDIAYHYNKIQRGFNTLINVFGSDHGGYLSRLSAAVKALSDSSVSFEIKSCQLVNFLENGVPARMSKRAGTFITLKDVIQRVGADATRFMMISKHHNVGIDFDFEKVLEKSKENPFFYIQYAHARICSALRQAKVIFNVSDFNNFLEGASLKFLQSEEELFLTRLLVQWPHHLKLALQKLEPNRLCHYLYYLCESFHFLWSRGKEASHLRFIHEESLETTKDKILLIMAVQVVIRNGLIILGITPIQEMR